MHESLLKEINEMLALFDDPYYGKHLITHICGGLPTGPWQRGVPAEVRADVTRAVREALLERREAIRKENVRRLLEDDARNLRAVLYFPPNDTLKISDGERTVSVSGELAVTMLQELKQRAGARLKQTLASLAELDEEDVEDEEDEK